MNYYNNQESNSLNTTPININPTTITDAKIKKYKDSIIAILNNSINKLNNFNRSLHGTHQLSRLTPNQENIFCNIFKDSYKRLKRVSNDMITYNANNNKYYIKLSYELYQQEKVVDFELTENEFIKLLIDSILFAMFKYKGNTVWTRDIFDNSVLVSNPALKRNYHYLMSKIVLYIFDSPELSFKLQQLADDYFTPILNNTSLPYDPSSLPRPKTPDDGWPSLRKGGTKKRSYSPNKSSSVRRKRRKLYSYKRKRVKSRSK